MANIYEIQDMEKCDVMNQRTEYAYAQQGCCAVFLVLKKVHFSQLRE